MSSGVKRRRALLVAGGCLIAALGAALAAQHLSPREVDALASKPADARVAYGTDALQFGDLRLPAGEGPFPVVVVIHGACWLSGYATHGRDICGPAVERLNGGAADRMPERYAQASPAELLPLGVRQVLFEMVSTIPAASRSARSARRPPAA